MRDTFDTRFRSDRNNDPLEGDDEAGEKIPRGLDAYEKFVINNHLNLEIYNTIY